MRSWGWRAIAAVLSSGLALAACGGVARNPPTSGATPQAARPPLTPAELARSDHGKPAYTRADVEFLSGMIPHHAQAVLIAGWAPSHGAGPAVSILCERIVVAQRDEIVFMQRWLRDRGEPVPSGDPAHADHSPLMPGMLTAAQLAQLDQARGPDFDRLFLGFMIQHHQGALTMVERLFGAPGAAHDEDVFKFASDVHADQTTEIEHMGLMLSALTGERRSP
jgi:uncharacterized protein (DUF305 family)